MTLKTTKLITNGDEKMGGNDEADKMNARADAQQAKADSEMNDKREALTRTRFDIMKTMGEPMWRNSKDPSNPVNSNSDTL